MERFTSSVTEESRERFANMQIGAMTQDAPVADEFIGAASEPDPFIGAAPDAPAPPATAPQAETDPFIGATPDAAPLAPVAPPAPSVPLTTLWPTITSPASPGTPHVQLDSTGRGTMPAYVPPVSNAPISTTISSPPPTTISGVSHRRSRHQIHNT